ncbi:VOC family protein [Rhodococcus aerolatus]
MRLENVVIDAADPATLGRSWAALLGAEVITDEPDLLEARLDLGGGAFLDLCLPRVGTPPVGDARLHLDVASPDGGSASADPEGTPVTVVVAGPGHVGPGPLVGLRLESADPVRDRAFWAGLTGWRDDDSGDVPALRHPGGTGPRLELVRERRPKPAGAKNRVHLDVRPTDGDDADAVLRRAVELGGREIDPGWGDLPWRVLQDPSGNEWCLLPGPG